MIDQEQRSKWRMIVEKRQEINANGCPEFKPGDFVLMTPWAADFYLNGPPHEGISKSGVVVEQKGLDVLVRHENGFEKLWYRAYWQVEDFWDLVPL